MIDIKSKLKELSEESYRDFMAKLVPSIDKKRILGVRVPRLRALAKSIQKTEVMEKFLRALPHASFDEDMLHAILLSDISDTEALTRALDRFLPYVDNWAVCDALLPTALGKNHDYALALSHRYMEDSHAYTVRFAIGILMRHFLGEDFHDSFPARVAAIKTEDYYLSMAVAWYFATALDRRYEDVIFYLENRCLDSKTHVRTIRKAHDSLRIPKERKEYLKTLL